MCLVTALSRGSSRKCLAQARKQGNGVHCAVLVITYSVIVCWMTKELLREKFSPPHSWPVGCSEQWRCWKSDEHLVWGILTSLVFWKVDEQGVGAPNFPNFPKDRIIINVMYMCSFNRFSPRRHYLSFAQTWKQEKWLFCLLTTLIIFNISLTLTVQQQLGLVPSSKSCPHGGVASFTNICNFEETP